MKVVIGIIIGFVLGIIMSPAISVQLAIMGSRQVRDLTWRDRQGVDIV